ncbi:dihydrodipicolinate synthase family protein [Arthrobacter sp. GCM10027362]|uniref:dihydrodipicolinate synthase family protein n=1 Tax=Arthrobacter sp. GCM10027362 TaxID=3273379 RepID=UPI00362D1AAA
MFAGLCAFPITPVTATGTDDQALAGLVRRISTAGADSIGILGSTGGYAYLPRKERARIIRTAVDAAGAVPVVAGIGALTTDEVLRLAEDAQQAGASGVLLAPMTYQPLTAGEVYGLYADTVRELSVPLCVYDNPGTTGFHFADELHARIAHLPQVASIKIPAVPLDEAAAAERISRLRRLVPVDVTLGISGDWSAATALNSGCAGWYSVVGGLFPDAALRITWAARDGRPGDARAASEQLEPLWALFRRYGSLRVISAAAEIAGLVRQAWLPRPLLPLDPGARHDVEHALAIAGLHPRA